MDMYITINALYHNYVARHKGQLPDTLLTSTKTYYRLIDELNYMIVAGFVLDRDGKHKYMGMDMVHSMCLSDEDIRVCKTKFA